MKQIKVSDTFFGPVLRKLDPDKNPVMEFVNDDGTPIAYLLTPGSYEHLKLAHDTFWKGFHERDIAEESAETTMENNEADISALIDFPHPEFTEGYDGS